MPHNTFLKDLIWIITKVSIDLPDKAGDHIGPVVSKVQYDKIINLINLGIKEGANLSIGGPESLDISPLTQPELNIGKG